jgi:hypothetical protein
LTTPEERRRRTPSVEAGAFAILRYLADYPDLLAAQNELLDALRLRRF